MSQDKQSRTRTRNPEGARSTGQTLPRCLGGAGPPGGWGAALGTPRTQPGEWGFRPRTISWREATGRGQDPPAPSPPGPGQPQPPRPATPLAGSTCSRRPGRRPGRARGRETSACAGAPHSHTVTGRCGQSNEAASLLRITLIPKCFSNIIIEAAFRCRLGTPSGPPSARRSDTRVCTHLCTRTSAHDCARAHTCPHRPVHSRTHRHAIK